MDMTGSCGSCGSCGQGDGCKWQGLGWLWS